MTHVFNEMKFRALEAYLVTGADIRVSWHITGTSVSTQNDSIATNADFTTPNEFVGTGYTAGGFALAGETANKDDANDRGRFDANDLAAGNVSAGNGTVVALLVYKFNTTWANSTPICVLTGGDLPFIPNGGTIDINWDAVVNAILTAT